MAKAKEPLASLSAAAQALIDPNVYQAQRHCSEDLDEAAGITSAVPLIDLLSRRKREIDAGVAEIENLAERLTAANTAREVAKQECARAQTAVDVGTLDREEAVKRYADLTVAGQAYSYRVHESDDLAATLAGRTQAVTAYIADKQRSAAFDLALRIARAVRDSHVNRDSMHRFPNFPPHDVDDVWAPLAEARALAWFAAPEQRYQEISEFGSAAKLVSVPLKALETVFAERREAAEAQRAREIEQAKRIIADAERRVAASGAA
jgi:hypothetical protein